MRAGTTLSCFRRSASSEWAIPDHHSRTPLWAALSAGTVGYAPFGVIIIRPKRALSMPNYMGYMSLALYAASFLCYARLLYAPNVWLGRLATLLLAGGIALHFFALLDRSMGAHVVPYDDLYGSMSLFAWLLGITYLGLELFHRQRSVGAFVTLLLVVWMVVLDWLAPHQMPSPPQARGPLFA